MQGLQVVFGLVAALSAATVGDEVGWIDLPPSSAATGPAADVAEEVRSALGWVGRLPQPFEEAARALQ